MRAAWRPWSAWGTNVGSPYAGWGASGWPCCMGTAWRRRRWTARCGWWWGARWSEAWSVLPNKAASRSTEARGGKRKGGARWDDGLLARHTLPVHGQGRRNDHRDTIRGIRLIKRRW